MSPRPDLPPMTERISRLPMSERGYPIPWFVAEINGVRDFRIADGQKLRRAVRENLCYVCGERLGGYKCFPIGPMCSINRISSEPPSHLDCCDWSARACPFLLRPNMVRREDEKTAPHTTAGMMIKRNPGVTALWVTKDYSLTDDGAGGVLFKLGDPIKIYWYREGRLATRAEVQESITTGLPALEAACEGDPKQLLALRDATLKADEYLPL